MAGSVAESAEPGLGIGLWLGLWLCERFGDGLGGTLDFGADLAGLVAESAEGFWVGFCRKKERLAYEQIEKRKEITV